ncbi:MAG TPA: hypothetical protein VEZ24_16055 [Microvirga sp.]|nr:hypothetical protein [Microvirga sp.]
MSDTKKLARFLVAPSSGGGDPHLVIELEDGFRLALTASFAQIEDMADVLDDILDTAPSGEGSDEGSDQDHIPAFLQKDRS